MRNYYGIDFKKKRAELLESSAAQPIISEVIAKADAAIEKIYDALKFSDYMIFAAPRNEVSENILL